MRTRMKWFTGAVAALALIAPAQAVAGRAEIDMLPAGFRVPVGALWLIVPMLLAVAGAVTLGWRRAAAGGRPDVSND